MGVNLFVLTKAAQINIYTQKWAHEIPQRTASQLHKKVCRAKNKTAVHTNVVIFAQFLNKSEQPKQK